MSRYDEHLISQAGGDGDMLDHIQRRADKATAGPWKPENCGADCCVWVSSPGEPDGQLAGISNTTDAEFIAHARTDIPALIALAREQSAKLVAVRAMVGRAEIHGNHTLYVHEVLAALESKP